ncbi:Sensor histidine kinase YesM [Paenibacillus uliginis N3/975]|uniref:Sensor histidine kinase YesM n=1 Tax=Paenibacillus uliginis N3/975 TaxID=1313296 RepID=A0A1X7GZA6_9BACL|nr:histidine kinase [Paenibacillus uliginis]SMF77107.1 Sensor histidine kinase YesM [Paenibacillus uliginis N3/975]
MGSFLQIKIYRHKFIAYVIFVVAIGLTLGTLTCAMLLNQWVGNARIEAANAFSRVENELQYDADRIEAYMQRIYSNTGLMDDARSFLSSSAEGYLTSRLQNSQFSQPLVSFPEDVKTYLYSWAQGEITQISLHTDQYGNVVRFNDNGIASFAFGLPNTDDTFHDTIMKGFVYRKKLSDPTLGSQEFGELRFLVSSEQIFKSVQSFRLGNAAAVSPSGDIYLIGNGEDQDLEELSRLAAANGRSYGFISRGALKHIFFVSIPSTKFNFKFVSIIDLYMLIRQHAGMLITIFLIVLAAMISVLLLIAYNMRDDALFLRRIIQSIGRVKMANFTPNRPARYRRNEYGMIARELDDMIQQLDKHIRNEYLLKIKQQETEMKALQHQINPHFLYNTLEVIRSTALVNQDRDTADAIATLGTLYREIVKQENIISIASELELLQKYLEIMEFKYPERFYYQVNVEPTLLSIPTVKFWMQPLAENFFIHGFNANHEFNLYVVNGFEAEDRYVLEFVDNGRGIPTERLNSVRSTLSNHDDASSNSIGLRNVYTRLHFFYGNNFSIEIENNKEAGVKISVRISKEVIEHVQTDDCG